MTTLRPELQNTNIPPRIARLPIDERGYPVPWFVDWVDGVPEFRALDPRRFIAAIAESRCWVCGERLGHHRAFVIGPMCAINRTTSEPPCHSDCAEWSAQHCPFLSRPHARRREDDVINADVHMSQGAGCPILRNPGVALVWWTQSYEVFRVPNGRLISIGPADRVRWFAEGRDATRAEVEHSITTGLPFLLDAVESEPTPWDRRAARAEFDKRLRELQPLLPAAAIELVQS